MIQDIKINGADSIVASQENVLIIMDAVGKSSESSMRIVDEISDSIEDWSFYAIDILEEIANKPAGSLPVLFEPDIYPTLFIFKDGVRKLVISKEFNKEDLTEVLGEIANDSFYLVDDSARS
jgi:hypothetical protein